MRYFVELSYNGKNYHGWQFQPNAISVQEIIENALSLLLGNTISVVGCGRTDTGVHASQYFLHFEANEIVDYDRLVFKLNAYLPKDIVIHKMFLVQECHHARFDAQSRSYEYRIYLGKSPFNLDTICQIRQKEFDIANMNKACEILMEYENFKSFSRSNSDVKSFSCTISRAEWILNGNYLTFFITANRFLRNMVRAIVGTMLDVGQGKTSLEEFRGIIEAQDRTQAGTSAKAKGLFLAEVGYPKEVLKNYNDK